MDGSPSPDMDGAGVSPLLRKLIAVGFPFSIQIIVRRYDPKYRITIPID